MEKLLIIDGNSIVNRAFYAFSGRAQMLMTSDGLNTNGIFGFLNILTKYIEEEKPEYVCVAFDLKAPTFRHKMYSSYKANRKGMPDELAEQMPVLKKVLDAMNIKRLEIEGFEADDIIGTVSKFAEKNNLHTIVVTGDKDALQLVSDNVNISLPVTKKGKTETELYDDNKIIEKYGMDPLMLIDVKGLMGDNSDNIPGVFGVGEKSALSLIKEFKSLENVYENIETITKKALKTKLEKGKESAFISKKLAEIKRDVPWDENIESLKLKEFDNDKLFELFNRLEFKKFIEKFSLKGKEKKIEEDFEIIENKETLKLTLNKLEKENKISFYPIIEGNKIFEKKIIGLAISGLKNSYYINMIKLDKEIVFEELKIIFQKEEINKIFYDTKSLMIFLFESKILIKKKIFDIHLATYLLNPTSNSFELSSIAFEFLSVSIKSSEELTGKGKKSLKFEELEIEEVIKFAIINSRVCFELENILLEKLVETNQLKLFEETEVPLIGILGNMEFEGIDFDVSENEKLSKELNQNLLMLENNIYMMAGEEFNINSPKQLGKILFEKLELPVVKKTKTGYSTDVEVLEKLENKHEIIGLLLEYRQYMKLKSTYVDGLKNEINEKTKKIHSSFNQMITATGRISSTEPNLQNIPIKFALGRRVRKSFIPKKDCKLLSADYSQIELRVLAHLADDDYMINSFVKGEDIHINTAAKVFKVDKGEVTDEMRSRAKAVNFGIVYGISDFGLAKDLHITKKEAKKYIEEYFATYPKIKIYLDKLVSDAKEYGYVRTILNRIRYIPEIKSRNYNVRSFGERIAMNTPIQGSAADIIKIAMVNAYMSLESSKLKSKLILQVHDELVINMYEDEKKEVYEILKKAMKDAYKLNVPLDFSLNEGENWYEAK
jgi:DNA polymerase-1